MFLKSITLRDWKAYAHAKFDFPSPRPNKNIILIGAKNGFGKTSLFEAIVLGLFGKNGLPLIARAPFSGAGEERLATSYKSFLEKAINKNAITSGHSTSCSVTLVFGLDEDDEEIEIRRVWNFSDTGIFRPNDEEIQIYEGVSRKVVGPRGVETDRAEWFRDYIAKKFLPYYLAAFFMFDGEQVSAFAEREMSVQVRQGIEGLLGIPVLRELADDLRKYAVDRRRSTPSGSNQTLSRLETEREEVAQLLNVAKNSFEELIPQLQSLSLERDGLTRELESFGAGSQAAQQEQLTDLKRYEGEIEASRDQLNEFLSKEVSVALSGKNLREQLIQRLEAEEARDNWEAGRAQGDRNLTKFLDLLSSSLSTVEPPFVFEQTNAVEKAIKNSWDALWYPAPENCAEDFLHPSLTKADRERTIRRLMEIDQVGGSRIMVLLDKIASYDEQANKIKESLSRLDGIAPQLDQKRERMKSLNTEIDTTNRQIGSLRNEIASLESQLQTKNTGIAKLGSQLDQAQPSMRRATKADFVAVAIDEIVKQAVPSQISDIAARMTETHKLMSHKSDLVDRIDIDENCNVKLLNSSGFDVRDLDLSAGEKQIFTQALISAVAHVSGRAFPMIIDTPLGRLDAQHRLGVIKHLSRIGSQVILLSTNTEIVGEYYSAISPYLLKEYIIDQDQVSGFGSSNPRVGYFEEGKSS